MVKPGHPGQLRNPGQDDRGRLASPRPQEAIAWSWGPWRVPANGEAAVMAEPLIHIAPTSQDPADVAAAREASMTQYQAFDMISGRMDPELGGSPDLLDLVGSNFYPHNQWRHHGATLPLGHHDFRPLSDLLEETSARYGRPVIIAETGAEGSARAAWLHYVCQEVAQARAHGADIGGICLYPVTSYPGWDDDRACSTGLVGPVDAKGGRPVYEPLAAELARQAVLLG